MPTELLVLVAGALVVASVVAARLARGPAALRDPQPSAASADADAPPDFFADVDDGRPSGRGRRNMNPVHLVACRSGFWRRHLDHHVLPRVLRDVDVAGDVLELGPGPGLVTRRLMQAHRQGRARVTAVEIDQALAAALERTYGPDGLRVVRASASQMPLPDASFDLVVACTMLHHVPTVAGQDAVLREAIRVLRPGGVLVGSDSLPSALLRLAHIGDTFVPIDVDGLPGRLRAAGGLDVDVEERASFVVFRCRRPAEAVPGP